MPKDKVIAYFCKPKTVSLHTNGVLGGKGTDLEDRKVLVDVGDRCVAPAKSKPKRRKTVRPSTGKEGEVAVPDTEMPEIGLGNGAVLWSEEVYSVQHLVKQFNKHFPVIVKVDQGHYQDEVFDLARGQVLLVSSHGTQKRVLARSTSHDYLSFPLDYEMKILSASTKEPIDLMEAVSKRQLPLTATFISSSLAHTTQGNLSNEQLTFTSVKDTVFLRANAISNGWTDQSEIVVIPDLLPVEFCVAQGLLGGTDQEWLDYHGMFSRCVRHLEFDSVLGFQGMLFEGPNGNELRSSINHPASENLSKSHKKEEIGRVVAYENVLLAETDVSTTSKPSDGLIDQLKKQESDCDDLYLTSQKDDFSLHRSSCQPADLAMVCRSNGTLDYKRPQEEPVDGLQRNESPATSNNDQHKEPGTENDSRLNSSVASESIYDRIDGITYDLNNLHYQQHLTDNNQQRDVTMGDNCGQENMRSKSITILENPSSVVYANCERPEKLCEDNNRPSMEEVAMVNPEMERDSMKDDIRTQQPNPTAAQSYNINGGVSVLQLAGRFNKSAVSQNQANGTKAAETKALNRRTSGQIKPLDLMKPSNKERQDGITMEAHLASEISASPDAIERNKTHIHPLQRPASGSEKEKKLLPPPQIIAPKSNRNSSHNADIASRGSRQCTPVASSPRSNQTKAPLLPPLLRGSPVTRDVEIRSSADVPSDLEVLSVASVVQCLQLLELDKYAQEFSRRAVDGKILTDMTERDLEGQFHFTPLDASKLVRFIRGWRP